MLLSVKVPRARLRCNGDRSRGAFERPIDDWRQGVDEGRDVARVCISHLTVVVGGGGMTVAQRSSGALFGAGPDRRDDGVDAPARDARTVRGDVRRSVRRSALYQRIL